MTMPPPDASREGLRERAVTIYESGFDPDGGHVEYSTRPNGPALVALPAADMERLLAVVEAAEALLAVVDGREKGLRGYYIDAERFAALRAALGGAK